MREMNESDEPIASNKCFLAYCIEDFSKKIFRIFFQFKSPESSEKETTRIKISEI